MKKLFNAVFCFICSLFSDLKSFRNKITVFVCVFCVLCIYYNQHETSVILACIAFLDSYLVYYLHNRKKSDPKPKNDEKKAT